MQKELTPYTSEYWKAALAEIDRPIHRCSICFRVRGEVLNVRKNGLATGSDDSVRRCEVRLCDINGAPRMCCTRCVKPPKAEAKQTRKLVINEPAPSLFDGSTESPTDETKHENE